MVSQVYCHLGYIHEPTILFNVRWSKSIFLRERLRRGSSRSCCCRWFLNNEGHRPSLFDVVKGQSANIRVWVRTFALVNLLSKYLKYEVDFKFKSKAAYYQLQLYNNNNNHTQQLGPGQYERQANNISIPRDKEFVSSETSDSICTCSILYYPR